MANYYANCRSNHFKVKDMSAFEEDMSKIPGIEVIKNESDDSYCILGDDPETLPWHSCCGALARLRHRHLGHALPTHI